MAVSEDVKRGTSDSCPAGFRIPTLNEFQVIVDNKTVFSWTSGGFICHIFSGFFLPASGERRYSDGIKTGVGDGGNYWTTYSYACSAYSFDFYSSDFRIETTNGRISGHSVRCISE